MCVCVCVCMCVCVTCDIFAKILTVLQYTYLLKVDSGYQKKNVGSFQF